MGSRRRRVVLSDWEAEEAAGARSPAASFFIPSRIPSFVDMQLRRILLLALFLLAAACSSRAKTPPKKGFDYPAARATDHVDTYGETRVDKCRDRGLEILSLSFDQHASQVDEFRQAKWPMPWLHAFVEGGFRSDLAKRFEVVGIPTPILVDETGTIIATAGFLRGETLEKTLADVFDDAGS